jgi:hypothetical protein
VGLISRTSDNTIALNALYETAPHAASKCRPFINSFSKTIKKDQLSLGGSGLKYLLLGTAMKVRWLSENDDPAKFRAKVTAHSLSLNMLLATANV